MAASSDVSIPFQAKLGILNQDKCNEGILYDK
jgi:hypothetical protein